MVDVVVHRCASAPLTRNILLRTRSAKCLERSSKLMMPVRSWSAALLVVLISGTSLLAHRISARPCPETEPGRRNLVTVPALLGRGPMRHLGRSATTVGVARPFAKHTRKTARTSPFEPNGRFVSQKCAEGCVRFVRIEQVFV